MKKINHKIQYNILSIVTLLLMLGMGLLFSSCGLKMGGPPNFPDPVVDVHTIQLQTWPVTYTTAGTLEAKNKADLNVEVAGSVASIPVTEGEWVNKGQTLIRLKSVKFNAQVNQARQDLKSAKEDIGIQGDEIARMESLLKSAESRRHNAEHEYERFQQLFNEQMISIQELDTKRLAYETAEADFLAAESALSAAQSGENKNKAGVSRAKAALQYSKALAGEATITAPFYGQVGQKFVSVGDYVLPGEKVITLADNTQMKIAFAVPEEYIGYLKTGLMISARVAGYENDLFMGQLFFVDSVVDEQTRTLVVKAYLQDPEKKLRHGQSARVTLVMDNLNNSIIIPEEALRLQGEKIFVYKAQYDDKENIWKAVNQEVTIGQRHEGTVRITSGLKLGDRVITTGYQKIRGNGVKVDIRQPESDKNSDAENSKNKKPETEKKE